jgi:hypothetical protein
MDWVDLSGYGVEEFEHIISTDTSDTLNYQYGPYFSGSNALCEDNKSVVQATNRAAKRSTGDILIYLSDDFKCPKYWSDLIEKEFAKYSGPTLIKVDDCLQVFHVKVLTIPIMNRACYEALGYFFHPEYKSMFCDEHLYHRTQKLGYLKFAPHLKFPHEHVSIGKAEDDDTYRRSAKNWDQGKALFAKHKRMQFSE